MPSAEEVDARNGRETRVRLDGQVVQVPACAGERLHDAYLYLERLAGMQNRVLCEVLVDGVAVEGEAVEAVEQFGELEAVSVAMADAGAKVVRGVQKSVGDLLRRVESVQFLVLINDWPVADRVWGELVPEFKRPMLELSYLQQIWPDAMMRVKVGGASLVEHWDRIGGIQAQIELVLLARHDMMAFSDLLEQRLVPWVRQLAIFLDRLDECASDFK